MAYFVTEYTIHFDDTMAYGSHHFLTSFKFQCASRESFLFGERVFDLEGVKQALDRVHLLTADAYSRNLSPAKLGERVAILLSLEEWGRGSARFCYRVVGQGGQRICAGFQTLICADAETQAPIPLPAPLQQAMDAMREIEEPSAAESFRARVLAGGSKLESLFGEVERQTAQQFLSERYPSPKIIVTGPRPAADSAARGEFTPPTPATAEAGAPATADATADATEEAMDDATAEAMDDATEDATADVTEAWVFAGQASFDPQLLSQRIVAYQHRGAAARQELADCADLVARWIGGAASALVSGEPEKVAAAVQATPALSQVAIHLQNVLGALLRQAEGFQPRCLVGHSFGEIAALGVGGCFDLLTGVHIVCLRVRAIAEHAPAGGGLLVVSCDRNRSELEAELLGVHQVVVAGRNHEAQTVLSGPVDELSRLKEYLRTVGVPAVAIDSPTSFHHPRLRAAAFQWLSELRKLSLKSPALPVYSLIGRRVISPKDDIAAVLAGQFLRSFDLQGGIHDLRQEGATKFVDCGSAGMLARLISKADPDACVVCAAEDHHTLALPEPAVETANPLTRVNRMESTSDRRQESDASQVSPADVGVPAVAIVGQGCILPGGASSPEKLFTAIAEQRVGIVDQRLFDPHWSDDFYSAKLKPDRSNSHLTGRVDDADIIPPPGIEAEVFDSFTRTQKLLCVALAPCVDSLVGAERILCLIGATADGFEDQDEVSSLRYAGIDPCDRQVNLHFTTDRSAGDSPHSAVQAVFDRIVRPGLKVTLVDAACASSLYAVSLGMQALETNQADAVIAGGVFCPGPGNSCLFSQFRGTTATGCRPFDANADGVVFSEGAALVTLRRRRDAQRLGLPIHASVIGAGLSSDGKSSSANVPQTRGQLLSLERCYANYEIDPATIMAIEGHGTSTPVGDSTELETLRQFFAGRTAKPIPVHSLKGLLGHAGWAAGTASVIAVCEYLRRGVFPAQAMHREPSAALKKSDGTLSVATTPVSLPQHQRRIAIDGFGFGGANAHLVLEEFRPQDSSQHAHWAPRTRGHDQADELVFVACYQEPTTNTTNTTNTSVGALRFDRARVKLPKQYVVLPELADDLDISQTLASILTERVLAQLPQFDQELRRQTSLVLALSGKTERGIEATLRIMTPRFRRILAGDESLLKLVDAAYQGARPSGAYTLQCMMPNVAAGRAALLLNLQGPNFVVDGGANSLAAALSSAALLLHSGDHAGTQLAVVAAIDANSDSLPQAERSALPAEYAAAFVVTTRRVAQAHGLQIMSTVDQALHAAGIDATASQPSLPPAEQVQRLLAALRGASDVHPAPVRTATAALSAAAATTSAPTPQAVATAPSTEPRPGRSDGMESKIYVPVWVEKSLCGDAVEPTAAPQAMLLIVPSHCERLTDIVAELGGVAKRIMVAIVSNSATVVPQSINSQAVLQIDLTNQAATLSALQRIGEFTPDTVVVLDTVTTWERCEVLTQVASDNSLCEFLFLLAQQEIERLKSGSIDLWGLFVDGWNGEVHPRSGPIAGLLKSIQREFPVARTGTICTRGMGPSSALSCLLQERAEIEHEQEIVFDGALRLARRLRPAQGNSAATPQIALEADSVVVATGGAKGVTAVMLDALLRDTQCTVIAIGRSPLEAGPANFDSADVEQAYYIDYMHNHPGATAAEMKRSFAASRARWEAHQTMEHLAGLGGRVEYMMADVTNRQQMAEAVEQIVARHGRIDLLLHGAGVQKSKRLPDRTLEDFRQTFSIKVAGLHNIIDACYQVLGRVISTHVLTSAYSVFGNDGQHDYGAANETLDRLCCLSDADTASHCKWTSLAWLAWNGIGMTRGSEYRALAKNRRLSGIEPQLGQRLFREVLAGKTGSAINVPLSEAEHVEYQVKTIPGSNSPRRGRVREVQVKLSGIPCLPFHKVRNTPTLPGAWILDLFVQAGRQLVPVSSWATSVTVQDLSFARFVRLAHNQEPNLRVVAEVAGNAIDLWLLTDVFHPSGATLSKDVICASARIVFGSDEMRPTDIFLADTNSLRRVVSDPYCNERPEVSLSGIFECLSDIEIHTASRRATFTPSATADSASHIPALLLDAAWRVGAMYAVSGEDNVFVPVKIGRMHLPLRTTTSSSSTVASTAAWEIRSTAPKSENRTVRWDRTEVFDESGRLKLVVEDALATRLI